jgi:hypothetical protein
VVNLERLAEANFAAYGPDLAMSLNNLSLHLAESGDRAGGLEAIRRAVEIYEGLAEENFAAYGPDLARSLAVLSTYQQEAEAKALLVRARGLIEPFAINGTPNAALLSTIQEMLKALKRP